LIVKEAIVVIGVDKSEEVGSIWSHSFANIETLA
jgi:hypothetical protein